MNSALLVAKVGGSLYDLPDLAERLRHWRRQVEPTRMLLFPGGGGTTDVIRRLDQTHRLGEEASHWLALHTLSVNAHFLAWLLPEARLTTHLPGKDEPTTWHILNPYDFFREDEDRPERLPHRWEVTSDSLAVRVAALAGARELVLLKSVDWSGQDWQEAAQAGVVDGYFAEAMRGADEGLRIRVVNLRSGPTE